MSSRFRTATKFRHIKGAVVKKELWYADVAGDVGGESNAVAASGTMVAVAWRATGGGSVGVLPLSRCGKRTGEGSAVPLLQGHTARVSALAFSPLDDSLLATGSDDCSLKVWRLPADGPRSNVTASDGSLRGHSRRVDALKWHPSASGVVASASSDKTVRVWDVAAEAERYSGAFADGPYSLDWNYNGSLIALTAKDKKLRIFDPRTSTVAQEAPSHEGVKPSLVSWLGDMDRVVTTGFSKMRERKVGFWDIRNLSKALSMTTLDSSTGVLIPLYDQDTRILFLAGKGDGNIRSFEIMDAAPYYEEQTPVVSDVAQLGIAMVPKRGLDVMNCEIARLLKLCQDDVAPVSYEIPRKSHRHFAEDLYPRSASTVPALTAAEWFAGENKNPNLMSLDPALRGSSQAHEAPSTSAPSTSASSSAPKKPSITEDEEEPSSSLFRPKDDPLSLSVTVSSSGSSSDVKPTDDTYYVPKSVSIVRQTKFRHLDVKPCAPSECVTNLKAETNAADAPLIRANLRYFAVPWKGTGGQVAVLPLSERRKLPDKIGTIETGNEALAFDFHPHKNDLLLVGLDNAQIRLYQVPEDLHNQKTNHTEYLSILRGHTRRISNIYFHPLCGDVLVSTAMDLMVKIWDLNAGEEKLCLKDGHNEQIQSVVFNYDGSVLATSSKDTKLRLWDPRAQRLTGETISHQSPKASRLAWLGNTNNIFSSGFAKSSEREFMIFDARSLAKPLTSSVLGTGSGIFEPFYDEDLSVMFLLAMGDSSIRFWEITEEPPYAHFLTEQQTTKQQAGIARLPKTICDVKSVEVGRFLKLTGSTVEEFRVKVPRTRTEYFQDDVYPPTRSGESVLTSAEWFSGRNANPKLVNLCPSDMQPLSQAPKTVRLMKKFDAVERKEDAADLKEAVINKFYGKMQEYKEGEKPLVQDMQEGAEEDEWSD